MNSRYLILLVFLAGLGAGWFANTWFELYQRNIVAGVATLTGANRNIQSAVSGSGAESVRASEVSQSTQSQQSANANQTDVSQGSTVTQITSINDTQYEQTPSDFDTGGTSTLAIFDQLLSDRRYLEAMTLFEEQKQLNAQSVIPLKKSLLKELDDLIDAKNNTDFTELIDNYLSIYYDDVDVLLLLADFNLANGSYMEVVDVYLLAKTYAYSYADDDKVTKRFNTFVEETDSAYTGRKNWWFLINLYAHINTSGLMTSTHQYRQALAHLRSGDEIFAIDQFNQLLDDSLVGEAAASALNSLNDNTESPAIISSSPWEGADSIALEKLGNQYAVDLSNNRQASVKLLLDTGASMTAMSRASFDVLNSRGDAIEQDRRVFRTAGGLVQGTVFNVPELVIGTQLLQNTQIAVIDFDGASRGIDGLLGMNILGQFRFHIEQENSRLLLRRK